jgi:hypothetical protein
MLDLFQNRSELPLIIPVLASSLLARAPHFGCLHVMVVEPSQSGGNGYYVIGIT